jgi:very-short-patch-repair endonuclease
LHQLQQPIKAIRPRRIVFITTVFDRFIQAKELNDIFLESLLEEKFWDALKSAKIDAERQYIIDYLDNKKQKFYCLDFALFCKARNIDLECNGDAYHYENKEDIKKDTKRNRTLEENGWAVLRYPKEDIDNRLDYCINQVKATVDTYGGLQDKNDPSIYKYIKNSDQLGLF